MPHPDDAVIWVGHSAFIGGLNLSLMHFERGFVNVLSIRPERTRNFTASTQQHARFHHCRFDSTGTGAPDQWRRTGRTDGRTDGQMDGRTGTGTHGHTDTHIQTQAGTQAHSHKLTDRKEYQTHNNYS